MLDTLFNGIFESSGSASVSITDFLICMGASLVIGIAAALVYGHGSRVTRSFSVTLALLPSIVCVVIMMVNGSVGAGVAVAGTFSLVRFRSAPGTAREICAIFLAMAAGIATGMGYIGFGFVFMVLMLITSLVLEKLHFGEKKSDLNYKTLRITIPEDLDYTGVFDDLLSEYTLEHSLVSVKTANMGSLYKLTYSIVLKSAETEKSFIDKLRCRNGNLEISCSRQETVTAEL